MDDPPDLHARNLGLGEAEIYKKCSADEELHATALKIWRRDAGRSTPGIAIHSAQIILDKEMARKKAKQMFA